MIRGPTPQADCHESNLTEQKHSNRAQRTHTSQAASCSPLASWRIFARIFCSPARYMGSSKSVCSAAPPYGATSRSRIGTAQDLSRYIIHVGLHQQPRKTCTLRRRNTHRLSHKEPPSPSSPATPAGTLDPCYLRRTCSSRTCRQQETLRSQRIISRVFEDHSARTTYRPIIAQRYR